MTTLNGKYRLLRRIGEGAMGEVFEAEHIALGTRVALKRLHGHLARRQGFVDRVVREAQAVARIDHPHVVQVYDVERDEDGAFMVMELVEGQPLDEYLAALPQEERALAPTAATRLMLQVLDAVAAAHRFGVIHRDLKPANIILTAGPDGEPFVKVLDFGIAKIRSDAAFRTLTAPGTVLGTPGYMAPEQATASHPIDARVDVFCLGVVFYELLSGRHPAEGIETMAIPHFMGRGAATPLHELAPNLPSALTETVARAIDPDPERRFADAGEFRDAVAAASPIAEEHPRAIAATLASTSSPPADSHPEAILDEMRQRSRRGPVPPTIPAGPGPSPGASPSMAPTALDTRIGRKTWAGVVVAAVAALGLGLIVRATAGRLAEGPEEAVASIEWPAPPVVPRLTERDGERRSAPISWPGGARRVVGEIDGLRLEVTHARRRDAAGNMRIALMATGDRPIEPERVDLAFEYYRTHAGPRRSFTQIGALPLVTEIPLSHDGKHHLTGSIVERGRTVSFACDLCLQPGHCPSLRPRCVEAH